MRVAQGTANLVAIEGDDLTWSLDLLDNGYTHRSPDAAAPGLTDAWTHVKIHMRPRGAGPPTSELTLTQGDASTTSTVSVRKVGTNVRFGAFVSPLLAPNGPAEVFVDDVTCQVSDPSPP